MQQNLMIASRSLGVEFQSDLPNTGGSVSSRDVHRMAVDRVDSTPNTLDLETALKCSACGNCQNNCKSAAKSHPTTK